MTHRIDFGNVQLEVLFRALDGPDDIKKLLSLEVTNAWINEAREIPLDVLQILETRVGRYPRRAEVPVYRSGIIMDTNPPDSDHWWYRLSEVVCPQLKALRAKEITSYVEAMEEVFDILKMGTYFNENEERAQREFQEVVSKYDFYKQPSGLSPKAENLQHLDPSYYTKIAVGKSQEWIKVYVHGDYGFVVEGKPVYPEYADHYHYNPKLTKPAKGLKIFRGWDGGRTPACHFSQLTPDGRWLQFDEMFGEGMGMDQFSDLVLQHCKVEYPNFSFIDVGDPSISFKTQNDELSAAMILDAKGITLEHGVQTPKIRIECVARQLRGNVRGEPALQIGPKCEVTRKGFMGGYCYKRVQVSGERYQDKPDKNRYSHLMNAMEYVATRLFAFDLLDNANDDSEDFYYEADDYQGRSATCGY